MNENVFSLLGWNPSHQFMEASASFHDSSRKSEVLKDDGTLTVIEAISPLVVVNARANLCRDISDNGFPTVRFIHLARIHGSAPTNRGGPADRRPVDSRLQ